MREEERLLIVEVRRLFARVVRPLEPQVPADGVVGFPIEAHSLADTSESVTDETGAPPPTTIGDDAAGQIERVRDHLDEGEAFGDLGAAHIRAGAAMVDAARLDITATGDALKWFAAFATAGLFALSQFLRLPSGALMPPAQAIGLIVSALGFLTTLLTAGIFILLVELRVSRWLRNMNVYVASEESAWATYKNYNNQARRANLRGNYDAALAAIQAATAAHSKARIGWPAAPPINAWIHATVVASVAGFLVGVFGAAADFAVKMASVR